MTPRPVGSVTAITDTQNPANGQTFAYDDRDRLLTATGAYGGHSYSYSSIGNLLSKAGVAYTYGATAQTCGRLMPHAVTGTSDGKTYGYDCNGNMLSDGDRTFTWDADNKPVSITRTGVGTTSFGYSGDGARVKKVGPSGTTHYAGAYEVHDGVQVKHIPSWWDPSRWLPG